MQVVLRNGAHHHHQPLTWLAHEHVMIFHAFSACFYSPASTSFSASAHTLKQWRHTFMTTSRTPIPFWSTLFWLCLYSGDQRLPHDTGIDIPEPTLAKLGVIYRRIPIDSEGVWESKIDEFAKERGYKNRDRITVTREGLGEAYEEKIKSFFDECVVHFPLWPAPALVGLWAWVCV